jgi:hypothetical protein
MCFRIGIISPFPLNKELNQTLGDIFLGKFKIGKYTLRNAQRLTLLRAYYMIKLYIYITNNLELLRVY